MVGLGGGVAFGRDWDRLSGPLSHIWPFECEFARASVQNSPSLCSRLRQNGDQHCKPLGAQGTPSELRCRSLDRR